MKVKTIKVGAADYAKVAERIKQFREDCPSGSIESKFQFMGDTVIFTSTVIKDLANPSSARATANAQGTNKGVKAFEKVESISVGRALAMLGYCADGDIATSEEMEEFQDYQKTKKEEMVDDLMAQVDDIKTIEELREFYTKHKGLGKELDAYITNKSKELKETNKK